MAYVKKQQGAQVEVETATPGPGGTIEARQIGPHGPYGPMHPVDVDYMRAIGPHGATGPLRPMPMEYARAIGPHGGQGPLIPLEGVPVWERGQFTYGAGPFAPGGPGGGMTVGPGYMAPGPAPGPMSCPQVHNGSLVCVQAPYSPREAELPDREEAPYVGKGEVAGRGWPPEIGPQEEQMMEVGCVATGRRCGGSARAPAQYWCCPQPGGMPMPFIGSPFPTGFGGLGALSDWLSGYRALMLATGVAALGYLFWKKQEAKKLVPVKVTPTKRTPYGRLYPVKRRSIWAPPGVKLDAIADADWALYEPEVKDRVTEWSLGIVGPSFNKPGKWFGHVNEGYGSFRDLGDFKTSDDAVAAVLKAADKVPVSERRP